jgi:hypothetical protein
MWLTTQISFVRRKRRLLDQADRTLATGGIPVSTEKFGRPSGRLQTAVSNDPGQRDRVDRRDSKLNDSVPAAPQRRPRHEYAEDPKTMEPASLGAVSGSSRKMNVRSDWRRSQEKQGRRLKNHEWRSRSALVRSGRNSRKLFGQGAREYDEGTGAKRAGASRNGAGHDAANPREEAGAAIVTSQVFQVSSMVFWKIKGLLLVAGEEQQFCYLRAGVVCATDSHHCNTLSARSVFQRLGAPTRSNGEVSLALIYVAVL